MPTTLTKEFYTVAEVADLLKVSRRSVINMIARGYLPGARKLMPGLKSVYRIPKSDVERYLSNAEKN